MLILSYSGNDQPSLVNNQFENMQKITQIDYWGATNQVPGHDTDFQQYYMTVTPYYLFSMHF